MPSNYILLEKVTVGAAGAASVTFNSIPQTGYTDLVVKMSARDDRNDTGNHILISFNGNTSNFTSIGLFGSGTTVGSYNSIQRSVGTINSFGNTTNVFSNNELYITNYTGSNNKSYNADSARETNATTGNQVQIATGMWSNSAAITSITFTPNVTANLIANCTFYLYGVSAFGTTPVIAPKATGGNIIMTDGTYWYHAFRSSGTFTPNTNVSCDVLVVAGGGGGATGGGGAGGVLSFSAQSLLNNTNYTATVGSGGAAGNTSVQGSNGTNSQFASLTATVGGGGGGTANANGSAGGSSGAGGYLGGGATYPGAATSGQGFSGTGNENISVPNYPSGGGGGSGAAGVIPTTSIAGSGGAGLNTWSSWLSPTGLGVSGFIAGGGGGISANANGSGGTGGSGGGGAGNNTFSGNGVAGVANTGSGGGGGRDVGTGGAGGSGLIIVRYAV